MGFDATMKDDTTERLDRLQAEVSELRQMAMMQTAILQVIAIKLGAMPEEYQARSPVPVPTPFDLRDMLKPIP